MTVPSSHTIEDLLQDFNRLLRISDKKSSVVIEKQKLLIIEHIVEKFKQDAPPVFVTVAEKEEEDTPIKKTLRRSLYYLLLVFGVLEDAANGFFFGSALFSLIPSITSYSLFIASVTYACIESVLFYLYDAAELKDALGITDPHTKLSPLIELYSQQIKLATELNQYLAMISSLNMAREQYIQYEKFVSLLNQDLKKKYAIMNNTHESWLKKAIRMCVFAFGAISSLAGSYFMATTVMIFCCPAIIATPIGVAIILATMAVGIVFHYAMDTTSMTRIVNPDYDKYQALKKDMRHFDETYSEHLVSLQGLRHKFEKKKTVDGSTQTDISPNIDAVPVLREQSRAHLTPPPSSLIKHSVFAPSANVANIDASSAQSSLAYNQ